MALNSAAWGGAVGAAPRLRPGPWWGTVPGENQLMVTEVFLSELGSHVKPSDSVEVI